MGKLKPVTKQFLAIACCNLLTLSYGLTSGWAPINLLDLGSENSTFPTGPLNQQESSLVISIGNIGGIFGNYMILPLSQFIGIKRTIHFLCVPLIVGSMLTIFARHVYFLYVARVLCGLVGGGLAVAIPTLVNDISHDSIRGALNSLYDPFNNCGMIISFFLGNYLSCVDQVKIQLVPPIIFLVILFFLPESPEYWTNRNKEHKATKSRRFYKGSIAALNYPEKSDFILVPQKDKREQIENGDDAIESASPLSLADFFTPHSRRAFFISFTSLTLSFLSGSLSISFYVTYIFKEAGSSLLSEKNSSILVSITTLVANLVFLNIVERFNRRTLYIGSSFITAAFFFLFAVYGHFWLKQPGFEWMPPFIFACIVYFSFMGLLPIPYILSIEIYPKKIRETCLAMAMSLLWLILFILGSTFFILNDFFGLFNCMIIFGVICIVNGLFGIFFVPETKGKSYEEIAKIMNM